jgi:hypothetical protein
MIGTSFIRFHKACATAKMKKDIAEKSARKSAFVKSHIRLAQEEISSGSGAVPVTLKE